MRRINICFLVAGLFILSACGGSKSMLISALKKENKALVEKNKKLNNRISELETALDEVDNRSNNIRFTPPPSPTPDVTTTKNNNNRSQLSDLEAYLRANDRLTSSRFQSFKKGGIEKRLNVSYADMQRVIKTAKTYMGTPHSMGGLTHRGIDCSGLLYVSFQANGITNIPRIAQEFARYGDIILNMNDIQAGDLVFFTRTTNANKLVTHVGICVGNGEFIHTSSSKGVKIDKINNPYWRKHYLFGTRIIN